MRRHGMGVTSRKTHLTRDASCVASHTLRTISE